MTGPILVTGAAGFVGGHLVDRLLSDGAAVVGWYRPGTDTSALRGDIEWRSVELLDRDAVTRAVEQTQPAAVYHLAGAAHVAQSWQRTAETYAINVLATHHLLSALALQQPQPGVLVSCSGTIYRPQGHPLREEDPIAPSSPYATSKLAQEMLAIRVCHESRMPVIVARSFNHTGPGQDPSFVASGIARQIARIEAGLQDPRLTLGNLDPKRDLSDVRDVVRAYVALMAHAAPATPYNVCSGRALAIRTLVEAFLARAKAPIEIAQDPALLRPNDAPLLVGDPARITAQTGWRPEIPLERTVDDLLEFWRNRLGDDACEGETKAK
jgi:GDP-4-dehydro-6-deoxy-D-mannose reductase